MVNPGVTPLSARASVNLDLLRLIAALLVFACHWNQLAYTGPGAGALEPLGRLGVIFFFLLSGFVIAHVAHTKHVGFREFLAARIGRLASVFVPALLATAVLDAWGRQADPALYARYPDPTHVLPYLHLPVFLAFLHESALGSIRWFSNGPMWSIAYEFWYYVLFAAAFYLSGVRRVSALAVSTAITGWKILVLAPFWMLGVLLYRARQQIAIRHIAATLVASVLLLVILDLPAVYEAFSPLRHWGIQHFGANYSAHVIWDLLIIGPCFLVLLCCVSPQGAQTPLPFSPAIRYLAGSSYSLYLFHVPLLLAARASGWYRPDDLRSALVAGGAVFGATLLLSLVTERRKGPWVRLARQLLRTGDASAGNKQVHWSNA